MTRATFLHLPAVCLGGLLLTGCVMTEKYEAEKARSLNFQRLLAQEEKRTGELDAELKRVKREATEMEARNRELSAQIQAVREQLASIQEEAAAVRETESMRGQMKAHKPRKAKQKEKAVTAPPLEAQAAPAPADAAPAAAPEGGAASVHVVQAGETVYRISRMYGVTVQQIRQWNHLKNDVIEVGQQLVVAPPQP